MGDPALTSQQERWGNERYNIIAGSGGRKSQEWGRKRRGAGLLWRMA